MTNLPFYKQNNTLFNPFANCFLFFCLIVSDLCHSNFPHADTQQWQQQQNTEIKKTSNYLCNNEFTFKNRVVVFATVIIRCAIEIYSCLFRMWVMPVLHCIMDSAVQQTFFQTWLSNKARWWVLVLLCG